MDSQLMAQTWLTFCLLGGTLGVVGQMIRVVAGLKKAGDEAAAENRTLKEDFDSGRLVRSLMIGGVAGVVAILSTLSPTADYGVKDLMAIVAAGYAGADFIEAFASRAMPSAQRVETAVQSSSAQAVTGPAGGPVPQVLAAQPAAPAADGALG